MTLMLSMSFPRLHDNFINVPADKASNNYTFVCKKYYVDILIEELGLHSLPWNPTYNLTDLSASEVLDNHKSVLTSFGIEIKNEELDLPYIYWIAKIHKDPYKHRFIAGSSKWFDKAFVHSTHKIAYTYLARSPEVLRESLLKEWDHSDLDPQKFKRHLRSS